MTDLTPAIRAPGRPPESMQVRNDLIHHARLLFIAHSYDKVSLRMVANNAGVNMAMIRYYFNNKAGLFETMLRETLRPVNELLELNSENSDEILLLSLMKNLYQVMSQHKNFPRLVNRSMQLSKEAPERKIVEKIMLEHIPAMQGIIKNELNQDGALKANVSAQLSYFSFLNLMIFPFIAPPDMLKLHGININDEFLATLLEHNIKLLSEGILNT